MAELREALERLISDAVTLAAKTSPGINAEFDGQFVIDWRHGLPDFVAALDSLALIVPRSELAMEFGVSDFPEDIVQRVGVRKEAIEAAHWRRVGGADDAEAYERPILPWTPIPLPEESEP